MSAGTFFLQEMDTSGAPPAFLCLAPSCSGSHLLVSLYHFLWKSFCCGC